MQSRAMNKDHGIESKAESINSTIDLMIFSLTVSHKVRVELAEWDNWTRKKRERERRCGPHKASDIKAVKSKCPCSINRSNVR